MNINITHVPGAEAAACSRPWSLLLVLICVLVGASFSTSQSVLAQNAPTGSTASAVRSFDGGLGNLFRFSGGSLYTDRQGTQGFLYFPGQNFQTYNFRNPTTGQAWSGAVMTFGPQLSIGLIQGANQTGSGVVLPGPPPQAAPLPPIESGLLDEIP